MGQQFQQRTSGFVGQQYDQQVPEEVKGAVADLTRLENVAEWASTKVAQRGMPRAVRVLDDIQDVAHLEKKLVLRESPFAQTLAQCAAQSIQSSLQELQQHASQPEVQETLQQTQQTLSSIQQGVSRLQAFGQGQTIGQGQIGQGQIGQGQSMGQIGQGQTMGQYGQTQPIQQY